MLRTMAIDETCQTGQSAETTAWSSRPLATTLRNVRDALQEGLAAHRQYEHLRSRGISHDTALRHAFAISQHQSQD
jgi:hypothetical protein